MQKKKKQKRKEKKRKEKKTPHGDRERKVLVLFSLFI